VVVANINAAAHESLAGEYARLAPVLLILSGFPERDRQRVEAAARASGFRVQTALAKEEWRCLVLCNGDRS
jgi:ribosomal protein L11 methylase PrmA